MAFVARARQREGIEMVSVREEKRKKKRGRKKKNAVLKKKKKKGWLPSLLQGLRRKQKWRSTHLLSSRPA